VGTAPETVSPATVEEAASALAEAHEAGRSVRIAGGGTKAGWGTPAPDPDVVISTSRLTEVIELNERDLTAVVQAGAPMAALQEAFAKSSQMLAVDPWLGDGDAATLGGVLATGDGGPYRHRYGGIRDLVLGVKVVLADGIVAKSGGKVIKNVAGYDLGKLFTGSFGTLGMIAEVAVRLHPLPRTPRTVAGVSRDPDAMQRGALALVNSSLQPERLDVRAEGDECRVLIELGGAGIEDRVLRAQELLRDAGLEPLEAEAAEWGRQARLQRAPGPDGVSVKISGLPTDAARAAKAAGAVGGTVVGRAGIGLYWVAAAGGEADLVAAVEEVRRRLAPRPCVVQDAPASVRRKVAVWDESEDGLVTLMRRLKTRFDPGGIMAPGIYVGGI
jgi:glycolate oxidase FAD binding subunit